MRLIHNIFTRFIVNSIILSLSFSLTACVTKRTVKRGNEVLDEKYVVKRPVKKFVQNVEFE